MKNRIFRPKILHRKRINNILSQILDVPIFFISASMGYSKTMSVKNFLEKEKDIKTIWVYSDNDETDNIWRWQKFCRSIKNTNLNLSKRLSIYGFPKNNIDAYEIIDIVRAEIKEKTVLVIDDWYGKRTIYINYLIKAVALEDIPNFHIVIISRNRPSDEYLELEIKQKCIIVWQDDMAFTFDETVDFFAINGFTLTEKEKAEVYEYTDGWISATYLALLQYFNKNTFDGIPRATELIKTAIYDKFDQTTKQILLKLAPVKNFTLEQAFYITKNKKSNNVIMELLSNNCFIRYDRKLKVYTLHSILKSALDEELLSYNIDLNEINNTCGDWYSTKFEDMEAIEYYYKAKNFPRILDLIERNYTINLTTLWKKIINVVFDELSIEEKINRPIAYLIYLFFYTLYGNSIVATKLLYEAKFIYEEDENLKNKNQILGEIAFVESLLMLKDIKKMQKYQKKAYDFFAGGTSKIANYKMPFTVGSPHILYICHNKEGELKELVESFDQNLKYFVHISNGCGTGANYLMKAEYFFEIGDFHSGELFAYKALHKAQSKKQTSIITCALFLLLRICVNRNDKYEYRNKFDNLINEYKKINIPRFLDGTEIAIGYIDGITGNLEDMNRWIKDEIKPNVQIVIPIASMEHIIFGLAMILKGNYIELEVQAETMIEVYSRNNNIFGILYAYIFDSIAKYKIYNMDEAKKALLKAVELAKEDELIMCFVELSPHILPILKALEKESLYVKMLLPKCEKFNEIYEKNHCNMLSIELTPRELEVMKLVDEGYKQSEISEKLNIALITVKKHIASVYVKLKVKNKTIALNILKEKGII